jgi:hypothetical protein
MAPNVFKISLFWIHDQIMSSDQKQELRMAPNFTWIPIHIDLTKLTIKLKNTTFWIPVFIKLTDNLNAASTTPTPTHFLTKLSISFMATFYTTIGGLSNGESTDCGNNTITVQIQHNDLSKQLAQPGLPGQPGQHPQHPLKATTQSSTNLHILDIDHESNSLRTYGRNKGRQDATTTSSKKKIILTIKFIFTCNMSKHKCNMLVESRLCTHASGKQIKNRLQVEDKGMCKKKFSVTSLIKCISTTFQFTWKAQYSTLCGKHNIPPRVEKQLSTLCGQNSFYPPCVGRNICFIKNQ